MHELAEYRHEDGVSTITMDDGKVNAFSFDMLRSLHRAFDQAVADEALVLLTGRAGIFSAGFDLNVLRGGSRGDTVTLLTLGATLAERILCFPRPVVAACTGHAYPAGAFLLLASDCRIGVEGDFRIGLNEVRIGMTVPWFAIELARHRLSPVAFDRTVVNATMYAPADAVTAGFLDEVLAPDALAARAMEQARALCELDPTAHAATKLRARADALSALRAAIARELTSTA